MNKNKRWVQIMVLVIVFGMVAALLATFAAGSG